MVIHDHINFAGVNPLIGTNDDSLGPRFLDMSEAYNKEFRDVIHEAANNIINGKRCLRWWIESGAACSKCIDVCPYTSVTLGDHYGKDKRPEKFWELDVAHFGHRKVIY